jgi:hypothetical protein
MSKYKLDDPEEDSALPQSRFKVTVEFTIVADCADDAEADVNDLIREGVLALASGDEERDFVHEYDITDTEPAELF